MLPMVVRDLHPERLTHRIWYFRRNALFNGFLVLICKNVGTRRSASGSSTRRVQTRSDDRPLSQQPVRVTVT